MAYAALLERLGKLAERSCRGKGAMSFHAALTFLRLHADLNQGCPATFASLARCSLSAV